MKNLDPVRLRDFLGTIADAQRRLRELGQLSAAEFLRDYRNTESAKYLLIVATAGAIDLCNHIVARHGGRAPRDYADCFVVLAELGVISTDLAERLKQMARFRNVLVHHYLTFRQCSHRSPFLPISPESYRIPPGIRMPTR